MPQQARKLLGNDCSASSSLGFSHAPRPRNGWMTWHREHSLRRVRWSTRLGTQTTEPGPRSAKSGQRWREVQRPVECMCGDTCQQSSFHSCNTIGPPIRHTSWKGPEGNRWSLKAGGVGIDDWGFWQAFRSSIEGQLCERLQGTSWEQVWMAGQTSPRCSNVTSSL